MLLLLLLVLLVGVQATTTTTTRHFVDPAGNLIPYQHINISTLQTWDQHGTLVVLFYSSSSPVDSLWTLYKQTIASYLHQQHVVFATLDLSNQQHQQWNLGAQKLPLCRLYWGRHYVDYKPTTTRGEGEGEELLEWVNSKTGLHRHRGGTIPAMDVLYRIHQDKPNLLRRAVALYNTLQDKDKDMGKYYVAMFHLMQDLATRSRTQLVDHEFDRVSRLSAASSRMARRLNVLSIMLLNTR
jgi:hypothetical protein